ncbi:DUF2752 domain-containing protein [Couchioplanes azureus]|uniref:DUF2752 domain-containing protein n=1 Tax=Couchioplanes caeruleus TaxID=56438 RepID=UPI001670C6D4|nr:DUF2752 domain-containing protein [Couchioplanes caeruleus]
MSSATEPVAPWQPDASHAVPGQGPHPAPAEGPHPWAGHPAYQEPQQDRLTRFIQRKWHTSPLWVAPTAMLVCMAGAVGYTFATHPTEASAGAAPSCLLKYATGFICPGCGGTRAAWFLMHGDLPAAARHHALFVFVVPFLLYMYVAWAGKRLFGWRLPQLTLSPGVIGAFIAVWGVWSLARNLPWAPFTAFYV